MITLGSPGSNATAAMLRHLLPERPGTPQIITKRQGKRESYQTSQDWDWRSSRKAGVVATPREAALAVLPPSRLGRSRQALGSSHPPASTKHTLLSLCCNLTRSKAQILEPAILTRTGTPKPLQHWNDRHAGLIQRLILAKSLETHINPNPKNYRRSLNLTHSNTPKP